MLCSCGEEDTMKYFQDSSQAANYEENTYPLNEKEDARTILVYVCGAVMEPGVVELPEESRVVDAIALVGGMTEDADETYMNLAKKLEDGEKIYIPTCEEANVWKQQEGYKQLININTADADELCELSGIGESKAEDIIAYRKKHGEFHTKEDLMKVPGIKENLYEKIADKITVD